MSVRILLVEDDHDLQVIATTVILRAIPGAEIEVVDTAGDAIAAIARATPALIVSDYDLADGSKGGEVLAHILAVAPELAARFLFVSGNAVVEDLHGRVLMKPYAPKVLASTLRQMQEAA